MLYLLYCITSITNGCIPSNILSYTSLFPINHTSNVQGRERCSPVHNGLHLSVPVAVRLARHDARRINAEGDDDGKNHRYAENHVFR